MKKSPKILLFFLLFGFFLSLLLWLISSSHSPFLNYLFPPPSGSISSSSSSFSSPNPPPSLTSPNHSPSSHSIHSPALSSSPSPKTSPLPSPLPIQQTTLVVDSPSENSSTPFPHSAPNPREPPIFNLLRSSASHPISPEVRALAEQITAGKTNAASRARAIYDWITTNIKYDLTEWEHAISSNGSDGYTHPHDPASVLARGTTVCIGYAWLFNDLCKASGLQSTWLIGDVRGYRGTPDDQLISNFRHAWNAVQFEDDSWHLLDATWGSSSQTKINESKSDYYFDTPANQFVFDHLPENESWQMLESPLPSDSAFDILPNLKPSFFQNGLRLGDDYPSKLAAPQNESTAFLYSAPPNVDVVFDISPSSNDANNHFQKPSFQIIPPSEFSDSHFSTAVLPKLEPGEYILRIYSGQKSSPSLDCSADFILTIK